jgi:integrase
MPATQRGHARRLPSGKWQLSYYDADGHRQTGGAFPTKSAALTHYRDVVEPKLLGTQTELTLAELVELYLERHEAIRSTRTITTLRERMRRPLDAYGDTKLAELETMALELAGWRATLPPRYAPKVMGAFRQVLAAGVRWRLLATNPAVDSGPNPEADPPLVRVYTVAELDAIAAELSIAYQPLPGFGAATGLRPEEWSALERRHVDRYRRLVKVEQKNVDATIVAGGKTKSSIREVPLTGRALAALDQLAPRLDTTLLFPAPRGGPLNLDNFRKRQWAPAVEAAGVRAPATPYDLRDTFASNALAAGVTVFELARVMGTCADDRTPLRGAARRSTQRHRQSPRRVRGRARAGGRGVMPGDRAVACASVRECPLSTGHKVLERLRCQRTRCSFLGIRRADE